MDESTTGMIYFGTVVLICSILAHALQKQFWIAVGLASFASTALLQVIVIFRTGHLDAYLPTAMVMTLVVSALCATLVGAVFVVIRKLH